MLLPEIGVYLSLTRLRREKSETVGLLTVRTSFRGARTVFGNVLSSADFNCSSLRARKERATHLLERSRADDLDWFSFLEELSLRVLEAEEEGDAEVAIHEIPMSTETAVELDAAGLPLLRRHPTIWFGDGGSAKSYLALYAAIDLAQRGERVLYLDFEFSGEEHRARFHRLAGPTAKADGLIYRRCERSLHRETYRLRDIVSKQRITFVICDSVGFATDVSPEQAEAATTYFRALRELGPLGSLHLAHVNKSEQGDQKPFGSAFWHNGARATWYLKRTDADPSSEDMTVGFYHRKSNVGRLRPNFGIKLRFMATDTLVSAADITEHDELAAKLPVWQRMKGALRHGAMTEDQLADRVGVKDSTVRSEMARRTELFMRLSDGRIGLLRH